MRWAIRDQHRKLRTPGIEYWLILGPVLKDNGWTYQDLENTPPDWFAQYVVTIDELRREERRREKEAVRKAKRRGRYQ